ncbi:acyl-CoA dehydrogenase family protein [Brevundimonas sp.]|uniref:acyl-CoA dehydrogenase family protein n=1 Tax=Brevundimonas sp. TaxID=1871086 RepID=UPI002AB94C5A|nr:acyl-CoA dehydrogenase family protein [Brevundimonas sp.]MDZ4364990.1 acyl-CoA dehydrogenase family protein [Brevundimonas sp.]
MIDFAIEPEFEEQLAWVRAFVAEEVEAMDLVFDDMSAPYDRSNVAARAALKPLQDEVKRRGLWAAHLPSHDGGAGIGQVKLLHINEILGRTDWGPVVFGCQGPDSGNSEILAAFGTEDQKSRWLKPLVAGEMYSCFSMTEPTGGADPTRLKTRAVRDGDDWVITGDKWYASHAQYADFIIVAAVTDPEAEPHLRNTLFIVPRGTPGLEIVREVGFFGEPEGVGGHPYIRLNALRLPDSARLGDRGGGFAVAQARLGGGRIHHAMRAIGLCQRAIDMMTERAVSREVAGGRLIDKQSVQNDIAASAIALRQFRLQVLHAAWMFDAGLGHGREGRLAVAMVKVATADITRDIIWKAMHMHGALGTSNELPFGKWLGLAAMFGIADGPTEVHLSSVAKALSRGVEPWPGLFPREHLPTRRIAARAKLARYTEAAA